MSRRSAETFGVAQLDISLEAFIAYLETTTDDEWQTDTVRNQDNSKNCVMGHLVNWAYGKDYNGNVAPIWDWFEESWATTYMVYPVNDGQSPTWMNHGYDQVTPKARVIAYLRNLLDGRELTTYEIMDEHESQMSNG